MFHKPSRALWALAPLALFLVGCPEPQNGWSGRDVQPNGTYSVHQLGGMLGMRVEQSGQSVASLRSVSNRVTIFGGCNPKVLVNGQDIGDARGVVAVGGTLFVPMPLASHIEASLRGEVIVRGPGIGTRPPGPTPKPTPKPPENLANARGLVMLDPGHGGKDSGAISPFSSSIQEKDINLRVANFTAEALKAAGVTVVMTRPGDTFPELEARPEMANRRKVDVFVSLHSNSAENASARGTGVYVHLTASTQSTSLANSILRSLAESGITAHNSQPIHKSLAVLRLNERPAVLVEMGFMTNRQEVAQLVDKDYQQRFAKALAAGIADYLRKH